MAYFFTASQDAQAITTAVDLLFCTVAAEKPIKIWAFDIATNTGWCVGRLEEGKSAPIYLCGGTWDLKPRRKWHCWWR